MRRPKEPHLPAPPGTTAENAPTTRAETLPLDLVARIWILELRRKALIDVGGTSWPTEIWHYVCRGLEDAAIAAPEITPGLSSVEAYAVRRKARALVARYAAAGSIEVT
jgi:hypothetical protein